ncbi:hypothetical protein [Actinomyces trachealis]|uniref:carboxylate--amine ligase n=1 Tax=Actinomyces trachealis TaxID=2763540 RepID=UPI00189297B2|nr:hypothetical protein [Actinomyces trachealis]
MLRRLVYPSRPVADANFGKEIAYTAKGKPFRLLLLGGELGALSQARAYHCRYRVRASVLAADEQSELAAASMYQIRFEPNLGQDDGLVDAVNRFAALDPSPVLVSTSFDKYVLSLVNNRDRLASNVVVPYGPAQTLNLVTDKVAFARLAQEVGMTHPRTVILDFDGKRPPSLPSAQEIAKLGLPMIGKPAESLRLNFLEMEGFEKVFVISTREQLAQIVERLQVAGFVGSFLLQQRVPGDDAQMRILTCYVNRDHEMLAASLGHTVIEEHHPSLRGNPAVILTGLEPGESAKQAGRLLKELSWVGYANFDIKVDPRTGKGHFFELNPRLGRSNFYVTLSGLNPIELLAEDWIGGDTSSVKLRTGTKGMYLIVPAVLALAYGHGLRLQMLRALLACRAANPLIALRPNAADLKRGYYMWVQSLNELRRFHRYYPLNRQRAEREDAL